MQGHAGYGCDQLAIGLAASGEAETDLNMAL